MEDTAHYSTDSRSILRIGRQQALERWASFVSSAEALLKTQGMSIQELALNLQRALRFGSLEASLPKPLIEAELKKLAPFTFRDFHGMCSDINNWQLGSSSEKDGEGGPRGLAAPHLQKIADSNGEAFVRMYNAFCQAYVFGSPLPECPE